MQLMVVNSRRSKAALFVGVETGYIEWPPDQSGVPSQSADCAILDNEREYFGESCARALPRGIPLYAEDWC